jgi:tripartite ATP-independent transporter DctP family solute receptor
MKGIHKIAPAFGVVLSFAMGATLADAREFSFAHGNSATSYVHLAALEFKKYVEEQSDGEIIINIFPGGELGQNDEMVKGVRLGSIDFHATGNPWMTGFNPVQNVLDIPFLFKDADHAYRVLDGEIGQTLLATLEEHGLKGLGFWEIGFRNLINARGPIGDVDDLKGLKLRTTANPAHIMAFELLGANPQPMPFGEVYLALQTGVVDGTEHPVEEIYAMKFHEVAKYLTLTRHAYTAMVTMANLAMWEGLSPEQQQIVLDGMALATKFQRDGLAAATAEKLQALKDEGVEVIEDVDVDAFNATVYEQVKAAYEAEHGTALTDAIVAIRD